MNNLHSVLSVAVFKERSKMFRIETQAGSPQDNAEIKAAFALCKKQIISAALHSFNTPSKIFHCFYKKTNSKFKFNYYKKQFTNPTE